MLCFQNKSIIPKWEQPTKPNVYKFEVFHEHHGEILKTFSKNVINGICSYILKVMVTWSQNGTN